MLAAIGFFISIDELAALHELVLQGLHIQAGFGEVQTLAQNAWLLILPVIGVVGLGVMAYWFRNLPRKTFWRLLGAFAVYALGALVVEYASIQVDKGVRQYTIGYVVLEEGLEYIGLWLVIRATLLHILEYDRGLRNDLAKLLLL